MNSPVRHPPPMDLCRPMGRLLAPQTSRKLADFMSDNRPASTRQVSETGNKSERTMILHKCGI